VLFAEPLAKSSSGGGSSGWTMILLLVLMMVAMYFLLIRPQQKRKRQQQDMQSNVGVGAEVMTVGGLYGTIVDSDDETVTIEVSEGVTNRYAKGAIGRVITPAETVAEDDADEDEDDEVTDEVEDTVEAVDEEPEDADEAPKEHVAAANPASSSTVQRDPTAN
jgi:preprotein translocase subunit YajC